ncbi:MAG TPA: hypothetical protein VKI65_00100 [Gemmataceae bacterium]|nr:hypothetical protein [Gemmataceae bacterium]
MTADTLRQLEERVTRLEEELREVKALLPHQARKPWWERTAGMFEGDEAFAEIVRLGQKIRREERAAELREMDRQSADNRGRKRRRNAKTGN